MHPAGTRELEALSDPQVLFATLSDSLEKLHGLAQRRETYVQYLSQAQTSAEGELSALKAEVATTTEQLQRLKQEQDEVQQALRELNADLKQKQQQLRELEEQLRHKVQLSHDRLLHLAVMLEERKQEAAVLTAQAEEKVRQLRDNLLAKVGWLSEAACAGL